MREVELVPNARNLMESTRSIGYSLPSAVADLIDNSIAAEAGTVSVETPSDDAMRLMILDDGFGMDEFELLTAMRYGSRFVGEERAESDLGRFGLGLKVASLSQCRRLTVLSKREGGQMVGARWDLDHIADSQKKWPLQLLDGADLRAVPWHDRLEAQKSGTLVVWENLDGLMKGIRNGGFRSALHTRVQDLKEHLSLVFHRFIGGEAGCPFTLLFNGSPLEPLDPFLRGLSQPAAAPDFYRLGGARVEVEPFILPHPDKLTSEQRRLAGDLLKDQGFYVYRNKRLVIWGTWFRLGRKLPLSKLARVRVDIPASPEVDHMWSLDVKKQSALIPEELREALKSVVDRLTNRSGEVWRRRARRERNVEALWVRTKTAENTVSYLVNDECAVVRELIGRCPELKPFLKLLSAKLPLNSIYTDLASEKTIDNETNELDACLEALRAVGLDTSLFETRC